MTGHDPGQGPIRDRWLTEEAARAEIRRFGERFGAEAFVLAVHAALPLVLTPELVHLIRLNFLEAYRVPAVAEADLLLSPLCRPLDEPMYEMEPRVREVLLGVLRTEFGDGRLADLSEFLLAWLRERPLRERPEREAEAHRWVTDAWLAPVDTIAELEGALNRSTSDDANSRAHRMRVALLAEALKSLLDREGTRERYAELVRRSREAAKAKGRKADGRGGGSTVQNEIVIEAAEPSPVVTMEAGAIEAGAIKDFHIEKIGLTLRFAWIPPGEFMMGSPEDEPGRYSDESPQHLVRLTQGFYMQTTPVTQAQWQAVMGNNPSHFENAGPDAPVENVSWNGAHEFIKKLNVMRKEPQFRLPTEAEWEYACRAGTTTPFWTGRCLNTDQANYYGKNPLEGCPKGGYRGTTTPVRMFSPNPWGLHDMHGSVWEWCADDQRGYSWETEIDPVGPSYSRTSQALRGGSWSNNARLCRSAARNDRSPDIQYDNVGFRLARALGQF